VIDPISLAFIGEQNRETPRMTDNFFSLMCRASSTFMMGDWKRRRREAEARNDFDALDRLDHEYEIINS